MKIKIILLSASAALISLALLSMPHNHPQIPSHATEVPSHVNTIYSKWMAKYGKKAFVSPSEHFYRLKVFYRNYL